MATAELQVYEPSKADEIKQHGALIVQRANALKIVDDSSYQDAAAILKEAKGRIKQAEEFCRPNIERWHDGHKRAIADEKLLCKPYKDAEQIIKSRLCTYVTEQERKQREEQRRLEIEARKRAEDEALALAAQAEREGNHEEANAIINEPVEVAAVVMQKATPKVDGLSFSEKWSAQITDLMALLKEIVEGKQPITILGEIDMSSLNQMARAQKSAMNIAGVKSVCEKVPSSRSN